LAQRGRGGVSKHGVGVLIANRPAKRLDGFEAFWTRPEKSVRHAGVEGLVVAFLTLRP
jgi:hypothetical protein